MLGGILRRKERWGLSWRGWLLTAGLALIGGYLIFLNAYSFLAVTHPVATDTLVVEGWIHGYAIQTAVEEFHAGGYQQLFTTGGPVVGNGGYVNDYQTSASVGADLLKKFGIPTESVQMVPSHVIGRDRTYSSAIALRDWLREHDIHVRSLNIVTEAAHARRTRLLFEKALGSNVAVGVIAVPSPDFDARRWWLYSEGVEEVVTEGVAYLYAKFFLLPSQRDG
jgi:uncharacterized SAM-binding protein YcdF (DUF218 family)